MENAVPISRMPLWWSSSHSVHEWHMESWNIVLYHISALRRDPHLDLQAET